MSLLLAHLPAFLSGMIGGAAALYAVRAWERWCRPLHVYPRILSKAEMDAALELSGESRMVNLDEQRVAMSNDGGVTWRR